MTRMTGQWLALAASALFFVAACNDGGGGQATTTKGDNLAPVAHAGADQVVNPGDTVSLDGSASTDDAPGLTFQWSQLSGPAVTLANASASQASFVMPAESVVALRLRVTDAGGLTDDDDVIVTLNQGPVAEAGLDQIGTSGDTLTLDGSASHDDVGIVRYTWTQLDGTAVALTGADTSKPTFVVPASASLAILHFRLEVADDRGLTDTDEVAITVGRTLAVCLDDTIADPVARQQKAQDDAIIAFFNAHEGDTISFCAGQFEFVNGLVMTGKSGVRIRGAGRNATYLRFARNVGGTLVQSVDQDGISINRVNGVMIENLTIYDAPGNGLRLFRTNNIIIRGVKVGWSISDPPEMGNPYGNYDPPTLVFNDEDLGGVPSLFGGGEYVGLAPPATWTANGSYAFYPVLCTRILIEDSVSVGSSDAGVYVGQSSDILVRTTEAYHNVAGFEFENTYRAEFVDNIAHDNVGGFLVFDLPGRGQYGEKNRVHRNSSYDNNLLSFAPRGAIVGYVPAGIGMLVLASDQLEVYDNIIQNNRTAGLAIVNYGLISVREGDRKYDFFPEGMHIYNNTFRDNAYNPQPPNLSRDSCKSDPSYPGLADGVPGQQDLPDSTNDLNSVPPPPLDCITDNASLLPAILTIKNGGKSAQIIWDGGVDPGVDTACAVPLDRFGVPLTQANPDEDPATRYERRFDERGRPNYYIFDQAPACTNTDGVHHTYNAWKFDDTGKIKPGNGMCIEGNTFVSTVVFVNPYANVHFATADPTAPENLVPADNEIPTECPILDPMLVDLDSETWPRLDTFNPNPQADPAPTAAEIAQVCDAATGSAVNYEAVLKYNCPRLDQYNLFAGDTEPRFNPNGFAVPFELNSILFSDYATKYRFLILPPDPDNATLVQKALYNDRTTCHDPGHDVPEIFNCNSATLDFPVGTVFAKTFAFRNGDGPEDENVVETRLLIKRATADGATWVGMAYLWEDSCAETGGTRCARLKIEGATRDVTWNYDDEDPAVVDGAGNRVHYQGSTEYGIPNAGACLICHGGDDREPGAAPIGPKIRNLNRNIPGTSTNQLDDLINVRHYLDLPMGKTLAGLEKLPKWNVPGSSGFAANSPEDVHRRTRAYLEVNCMHCHNSAGYAQNSGLGLDAMDAMEGRKMGQGHGICKTPIAAGKAAEDMYYDIVPTRHDQSLLWYRLSSVDAGIKMPPLARSVPHAEAVNLVAQWIDDVVDGFAEESANTCKPDEGGTLPVSLGLPIAGP